MEFLQYTAGVDDDGRRIDRVIRIFLKTIPMTEIYKLIRKGLIRVNGKRVECNYRIKKDDEIKIPKFSGGSVSSASKTSITADVPDVQDVFKNSYVRIINKPYGMSVHGGGSVSGGVPSLEQIVNAQFVPENESLSFRPGPLHRIDRHTTGLVVFSQNHKGAVFFSEMLQKHQIKKEYLAVLSGNLQSEAVWEDMIENDEDSMSFYTVKVGEGKLARTKVKPIARGEFSGSDITLAIIEIDTGRKHQIRSQCAYHKFPLLGDTAYNNDKALGNDGRFYLHAWRMTFPSENQIELPETITAPLPTNFQNFIRNHLSQGEFSNYNIISYEPVE
ncbi:MAG: RluA family pseudouridine synthase [Spirochaetaceae bacterium]|nr:RluA family pseudouridine synthase [Spirochaetaceae bacterium]